MCVHLCEDRLKDNLGADFDNQYKITSLSHLPIFASDFQVRVPI